MIHINNDILYLVNKLKDFRSRTIFFSIDQQEEHLSNIKVVLLTFIKLYYKSRLRER